MPYLAGNASAEPLGPSLFPASSPGLDRDGFSPEQRATRVVPRRARGLLRSASVSCTPAIAACPLHQSSPPFQISTGLDTCRKESAGTHRASAREKRISAPGVNRPFSMRFSVILDIPVCSARASCDLPVALRRREMLCANALRSSVSSIISMPALYRTRYGKQGRPGWVYKSTGTTGLTTSTGPKAGEGIRTLDIGLGKAALYH